ncbi:MULTISPECIES: hypothetical protein [unclassified Rathayibacter]|uniref:hypothetical protein n=1 Tax=unclassified Rathayibacter TaxID=2609250 RepID=UPI000F4CB925|nr:MULTISPECIES: hypothetical protein [unclassified Rathayibacter]ROP57421.1 hypothetical protein EDF45_0956 [Rathayibacter sp. PhB186]ROS55806.1 hypothetical protein EDF44_0956 [Rathayibacter sp. PhB185]
MTSDALPTTAAAAPRLPRPLVGALLSNAVFGGITAVGVPVALNAAGLAKVQIAVFFVVNAAIAIGYNTLLVPRIRRAGYPRSALLATSLAVPAGILLVRASGGHVLVLYLGGALMLFVSTLVPQLFGRVAAQGRGDTQESSIARMRAVLISGYILGLILYALLAQAGLDPLLAAVAAAVLTTVCATGCPSTPTVEPDARVASAAARPRLVLVFVAALALVALLKSVDTLRAIYLPLFAVSSGVPAAHVPPVLLASAVLELAALPALTRLSSARGSVLTLAVVALAGGLAFSILSSTQSYPALLVSQAVYAVAAAGYQSIGLLLLERTSGGGPGAGASAYMAVVQIGTVLGALLPLAVTGYDPRIFLLAVGLAAAALLLALTLRLAGHRF